jgi:hypothetical protein
MKLITLLLAIQILATSFMYETYVYICQGPHSKVYHRSQNCKGLSNCSTELKEITVQEAQNMGRRACRIEY